jgi:hypothetical protein
MAAVRSGDLNGWDIAVVVVVVVVGREEVVATTATTANDTHVIRCRSVV